MQLNIIISIASRTLKLNSINKFINKSRIIIINSNVLNDEMEKGQ